MRLAPAAGSTRHRLFARQLHQTNSCAMISCVNEPQFVRQRVARLQSVQTEILSVKDRLGQLPRRQVRRHRGSYRRRQLVRAVSAAASMGQVDEEKAQVRCRLAACKLTSVYFKPQQFALPGCLQALTCAKDTYAPRWCTHVPACKHSLCSTSPTSCLIAFASRHQSHNWPCASKMMAHCCSLALPSPQSCLSAKTA